jgi:glutaredoxin
MSRIILRVFQALLMTVCSFSLLMNASQAQSVNKCLIGGKTIYQAEPCPEKAKAKTVDTSGKATSELGKDFAKSAKQDKARWAEIEKEKKAKEAAEAAALSDKPQMPQMRNPALERIEKLFSKDK